MSKKVLISLHDITPFHLSRVKKAEQFLAQWGVSKVSYLFIPDYHQENQQTDNTLLSTFKQWCRQKREFALQWLLHGYYHLETSPKSQKTLKHKLLTANEGEFLDLSPTEIRGRIREGKRVFFEFFRSEPDTFVAPAWLFNPHLIPVLKEQQFRICEDHSFIYLLEKPAKIPAPVITWATRTLLRKITSQMGCLILNRLWSGKDLIRIALHPFDFDYPGTIKSIEKVVKTALQKREPILYNELEL